MNGPQPSLCPGVPTVVRTVQDPSAATHGANDHGWGLPGVPSQVIIEVGPSQVLATAVGDPEDRAEDRKGRASIPGASHRTKYFSWWNSRDRAETSYSQSHAGISQGEGDLVWGSPKTHTKTRLWGQVVFVGGDTRKHDEGGQKRDREGRKAKKALSVKRVVLWETEAQSLTSGLLEHL